jgi:hypothetical protein
VTHHRPAGPLALLLFVVATAFLVWPLYPWLGNSVEPRVLGLPWSLTYIVLVVAVDTTALVVLYVTRAIDADEPTEADGG